MEMVEFRQRYINEKARRMTLHNTLVVSTLSQQTLGEYPVYNKGVDAKQQQQQQKLYKKHA